MVEKKGKKKFTNKDLLISAEVLDKIGPDAAKNIVRNRYKIKEGTSERSKQNAYSKKNHTAVHSFEHGCDLLQYSIVVKPYIFKKFNIKHSIELDILLYMYPIQFFTRADFNALPVRMYNYQFVTLVELGHFEKCVESRSNSRVLWRLSDNAMKIVKEYYLYLSGEMKLSPTSSSNPFRSKDKIKADKMRERMMMKLRSQSERNPERFTKYY